MQTKFMVIEHEDVRKKKLYYIELSNGKNELLINVGEKTFLNAKKLIDEIIEWETKNSSNSTESTETTKKSNREQTI